MIFCRVWRQHQLLTGGSESSRELLCLGQSLLVSGALRLLANSCAQGALGFASHACHLDALDLRLRVTQDLLQVAGIDSVGHSTGSEPRSGGPVKALFR